MIDDHEVTQLLRVASEDIAVPITPARELASAGQRRRHRRRVVASVVAAAAAVAVAVAVPVVVNAERSAPGPASTNPTTPPPTVVPGGSCVAQVPSRVLPVWARGGFSEPRPRIPYVLGDKGDIAAILFAQPLTAPPSADHNNKILWVPRVAIDGGVDGTLHIIATLQDGSATAAREVPGGPGPSIIDLPKSGCWHLTLRWAGSTDTMDLAYQAP